MKSFKQYLNEEFLSEAAGAEANAKGVAYELKLAHRLNGNKHPELHPNEEGLHPAEAHEKYAGSLSSEEHAKAERGADQGHGAIRAHLEKIGFAKKQEKLNVAWTSKPGQLARRTGNEADRNNPGDLAVMNKKGQHIAISAKYGSSPGLRSPGMKDLSKMMGIEHPSEEIDSHKTSLVKMMGQHVSASNMDERNKQFRAAEKNPAATKEVKAVKDSSLSFRSGLAQRMSTGFNSLSRDEHHNTVRRLLNAEPTGTNVIKIHHDPAKNETHISDPVSEFQRIHSNTSHYSSEARGSRVHIYAHTKDGRRHHLLSVGVKDKSSPMTNITGAVQAGKDYMKALS